METARAAVLAGGIGERLQPLTRRRAKGAVPFGGRHRLIDFTLMNCAASRVPRSWVITQHQAPSLQRHLTTACSRHPALRGWLEVCPAPWQEGKTGYLGTADAVLRNLPALTSGQAEHILVLGSDHVYRMDYGDMVTRHRDAGADLTIGCLIVPVGQAGSLGVLDIDSADRVVDFEEKPDRPKPIPGSTDRALISMGIYVFDARALARVLQQDAAAPTSRHDFGRDIIPLMLTEGYRLQAYRADAMHSGAGSFYWRDIGTVDAYWEASMDMVCEDAPWVLEDSGWGHASWRAHSLGDRAARSPGPSSVSDCIVCEGATIDGAEVRDSVLSPGVAIGRDAMVVGSVLLEGVTVGRGACVVGAVLDRSVTVADGVTVGSVAGDPAMPVDRTPGGVQVVAANAHLAAPRYGSEPEPADELSPSSYDPQATAATAVPAW